MSSSAQTTSDRPFVLDEDEQREFTRLIVEYERTLINGGIHPGSMAAVDYRKRLINQLEGCINKGWLTCDCPLTRAI